MLFLRLMDDSLRLPARLPGLRALARGTRELRAAELRCPGCGHRYDVIRAGRCLDDRELHLEPVPLLVDDAGLVKVALTPAPA